MSIDYDYKTCPLCGIYYAVDKAVMSHKANNPKDDHSHWYCPNGHPLVFKESPYEEMRRDRDRLLQQTARLNDEKAEAERQTARLLKRSNAGLCPCCNRSFVQLARHMKTKHPNITPIKRTA